MSIQKKYLPGKEICRVTFTLPSFLCETAKTAHVVGEFNDWDTRGLPMKKKNGKFSRSLELKSNNEYQYRYLIDGVEWKTDWESDGLTTSPLSCGEHNSIVKV